MQWRMLPLYFFESFFEWLGLDFEFNVGMELD